MKDLKAFSDYLLEEEKSPLTREKYLRDVRAFLNWLDCRPLSKLELLAYKDFLIREYAAASVNSILSSLNCYLHYIGRSECRVKALKQQRNFDCLEEKELTREEYHRLLRAAQGDSRLQLLMQTLCATGIRVSEHRFITVEAARQGRAAVRSKGKLRTVLLPRKLCADLLAYCRKRGIQSGSIFLNGLGKPMDRSRIWAMMKRLCTLAEVAPQKVYPHNLRHLFARMFYAMERDIVRLADILGHSSVNTTRIYTLESSEHHRLQIEKMPLLYIT